MQAELEEICDFIGGNAGKGWKDKVNLQILSTATNDPSGVRVYYGNRKLVITIKASPHVTKIQLEGRGDRLLVLWSDTYCINAFELERFDRQVTVGHHGRAIHLPLDVDFSQAVAHIDGSTIVILIPKQRDRPARDVFQKPGITAT